MKEQQEYEWGYKWKQNRKMGMLEKKNGYSCNWLKNVAILLKTEAKKLYMYVNFSLIN